MALVLYTPQNYSVAGAKVELLLRFIPEIKVEPKRLAPTEWKKEEYLKKNPQGKVPTLETPEGCIFESMAIMRYLARKAGKLYGNSPAEMAAIDQWLEFHNTQIVPLNLSTIYAIFGYTTTNQANYDQGKKELLRTLKTIDEHLKKHPFLGGKELSIADIALIGGIRLYLRLIFDEKARAQIPKVVEWFHRVSEVKEVAGFMGKPWLCVKEVLPEFQEKKEEKKEKGDKKEKGEKKKEKGEKKKEEPKKKQESKKKKEAKEEDEEEDAPPPKKVNPLDELPKSNFNIDGWKRVFSNSEDVKQTLKELWEKDFDYEGYSLWRIKYDKYEGEGVVGYLTNNLKNGYIRNIDHFRKYAFGAMGVYGVEGNYEIQGVWMWRGQEIPQEWKDHGSYDYFKFEKLNSKDEAHQALAAEYWTGVTENDKVEGMPVYDVTIFK